MLRFTLVLSVTAAVLLASVWLLSYLGFAAPSYYLETTILLSISVWVIVKKLLTIYDPSMFTTAYLGSVVLELLVWLSYLGLIFYLDRPAIQANAVYFLINCLVFISLQAGYLFISRAR